MSGWSKSKREISEKVDKEKDYPIEEAISLLKELSKRKFKESFDISINLGVDPKKSDQVVRGATNLPHGNGKEVRVAVIAQGSSADEAKEAGQRPGAPVRGSGQGSWPGNAPRPAVSARLRRLARARG